MTFNISGMGDREALTQIAKMAYGSGSSEKTSGGKGNIGICRDHAVKFNTHWYERLGASSSVKHSEMKRSCDALRTRLSGIATAMLSARADADPAARAKLDDALANVRRQLGMDAAGANVAATGLLERKVVASVINVIRDATGFDAWQGLRDVDENALSSKGKVTKFGQAEWSAFIAEEVQHHVQLALDDIAHPADGKPGVVLNEKAKAFLMELIERDVHFRGGNLRDIGNEIRDFTSPYLAVTLQAFNLCPDVLVAARPSLKEGVDTMGFLSGSPRKERADRADVVLSLFADASPGDRAMGSNLAMALVSEKMPEMRRIQPDGRLTGATVWKACFGESAPEGVAGKFGSRTFSDAFFRRLYRLGDDLLAGYGGNKQSPGTSLSGEPAFFNVPASAGMGFTASIRLMALDPKFRPNAARDFVAAPPLYSVADVRVMTEDNVRHQLKKDFPRCIPTVRLHDGPDVAETFNFADALEDARRQTQGLPDPGRSAEAKARFAGKVDEFVTALDARYGGRMTEIQRKVLLLGLAQCAFIPMIPLRDATHKKIAMDVRREDDGAFVVSYTTDRSRTDEFDVRYSYRIEPDGTNCRGNDFAFSADLRFSKTWPEDD